MPVKPKVLEFEVSVDRERSARSALGGAAIVRGDAWSPEHLVLAALVRCTLGSMDYSARRAGLDVVGSGRAHGKVTKRKVDGLYAFVDIQSELAIELDPSPPREVVDELVEKAERGCFVSNSLTATPRHRWTVNGEEVGR